MDVLRPPIVKIGSRCYRKNLIQKRETNTAEEEDYTDFAIESSSWNEESCVLDRTCVEETADGFQILVTAPSALFKFIIGRKGETKNRLEIETRTKIRIPRQGQEGDIVIQGHDKKGVISAKNRIDILLDSGRQKHPFTHFLSVPLNTSLLQDSFAEFKSDVLRECFGDRGLDESIFQNPCKLHLTLGCLVLLNNEEIRQAGDILQQCKEDLVRPILKGDNLNVDVAGLEYMNDDPSEVDVLYAKIEDPSDRLQILVDRLVDRFTSTGLMQKEYDRVKLHATVMNTIFRKDPIGTTEPERRQGRGKKDRESFNANNVLKKFGQYMFGKHCVNEIHISQRHHFGLDGYYSCAGTLDLT